MRVRCGCRSGPPSARDAAPGPPPALADHTCVFPGGGATTGTFSYALAGNLTCLSADNVTGTLDITWSDASHSHAT